MRIKNLLVYVIVLAFVAFLFGCGGTEPGNNGIPTGLTGQTTGTFTAGSTTATTTTTATTGLTTTTTAGTTTSGTTTSGTTTTGTTGIK